MSEREPGVYIKQSMNRLDEIKIEAEHFVPRFERKIRKDQEYKDKISFVTYHDVDKHKTKISFTVECLTVKDIGKCGEEKVFRLIELGEDYCIYKLNVWNHILYMDKIIKKIIKRNK